MTKLVVRLLGGFRVELDGKAVYNFDSDKGRALLAYLAVEADRPHRRETLAGLLWPDRPDTLARTSLRQALSHLRRTVADQATPFFLFVTPNDVQFNAASDHALDVAELEVFARSPARFTQLLPQELCADFLAGFAVPDSEAFEAWVLTRQEHYHRLAIEILDKQNAHFETGGDYERAVAAARLQIRIEPWLEEAHRRCMRALALAGRPDEALHQYEVCCRALQTELEVEPADSTQALYADIRAGKLAAPSPSLPISVSPRLRVPPSSPRLPVRLVARSDELGQLERHLDAALAGETGLVFVSGEAGSGKTALLDAFAASAMAQHPDLLMASARCSPGGSQDLFAPLRKLAEMLFGDPASGVAWRPGGREQDERLQQAARLALGALAEQGLGLIDSLVPASAIARRERLAAPWTAEGRLDNRPQQAQPLSQSALFDQLASTLAAISREQPLLLLLDDLHWVDDATASFLLHLGRELVSSRLLVIGAYRSATVALGRADPRSGQAIRHPLAATLDELRRVKGEITVDLDRVDGRAFVEAYVDSEPNRLGARFRDALYARTRGHALFTVESLRNLQERGELVKDEAGRWMVRESLDWGGLPARVEGAIAERIERLPGSERRLLACASVEGDDFAAETVAELAAVPVDDAITCLSGSLARQHHLVRPEGLQRLGSGQRSTYRFTHHLFQKYLYDQLDAVERARLHGAVAASLDRQCGGDAAERERLGARLAWHYEAAGLPVHAARALLAAGNQAIRLSAYRDALNRYDRGLALLAAAPPSAERTEIRRLLEFARIAPQRSVSGFGSAGADDAVARASAAWACDAQGRPNLMVLSAEAGRLFAKGQFEQSLVVAEQMRDQATQSGDEVFVAVSDYRCFSVLTTMGNPQQAEKCHNRLLASMTPERREAMRAVIGVHIEASLLAWSAINCLSLGYPEMAGTRSRQAFDGARERGDTYGQAFAAALGAIVQFLLRSDVGMAERTEQCDRLSREHGFPYWQLHADVCQGRLMVTRGEDVAGIERIQSAIAGRQNKVSPVGTDIFAVIAADSCLLAAGRRATVDHTLCAGLAAKGMAAVDSMLGPDGIPCGQAYQPELHRLRGELLLARHGLAASEEALQCFERALALGQEKGALAWELRAAMSLVRLRQRQGADYSAELAEARGCLREVYGRFTEGFRFPDLQDAKALIGGTG